MRFALAQRDLGARARFRPRRRRAARCAHTRRPPASARRCGSRPAPAARRPGRAARTGWRRSPRPGCSCPSAPAASLETLLHAGRQADARQLRRLGLADAVEGGGDAALGGDHVGPALQQLRGQARPAPAAASATGAARRRSPLPDSGRAAARARAAPARARARSGAACRDSCRQWPRACGHRLLVADADAQPLLRDPRAAPRTSAMRPRDRALQAGLDRQEPALGHRRGERLARVARSPPQRPPTSAPPRPRRSAAGPRRRAPATRSGRSPLQAAAAAATCRCTCRERAHRRQQRAARHLQRSRRPARRARPPPQIGVVGQRLGDQRRQRGIVERWPASGRPRSPPHRRRPSNAGGSSGVRQRLASAVRPRSAGAAARSRPARAASARRRRPARRVGPCRISAASARGSR